MTLAPISYDPDHDVKTAARALARALNRMADLGQTGQLYGQYKGALTLLLDKSCDAEPVLPALPQRGSPLRTASLITQRKPFNWLITKQPPDVSSSQAVSTYSLAK